MKAAKSSKERNQKKHVVIPAKAGIHPDLLLVKNQNGFPLSRE